MTKSLIINFIDRLALTSATFLFFFAWVNFYSRNIFLSLIVSLIITLSIFFVIFELENKKNIKLKNKLETIKKYEKKFFIYKMLSKSDKFDMFLQHFKNFSIKNIDYNDMTFVCNENKCQLMVFTKSKILTQENLICEISEKLIFGVSNIYIIAEKLDSCLKPNIFNNINIIIVNSNELIDNYLDSCELDNMDHTSQEKEKLSKKDVLMLIFSPSKSKSYFFCGFVLILSSIIIPYRAYYVVVGSMLMLFSIICKLIKKFYA